MCRSVTGHRQVAGRLQIGRKSAESLRTRVFSPVAQVTTQKSTLFFCNLDDENDTIVAYTVPTVCYHLEFQRSLKFLFLSKSLSSSEHLD